MNRRDCACGFAIPALEQVTSIIRVLHADGWRVRLGLILTPDIFREGIGDHMRIGFECDGHVYAVRPSTRRAVAASPYCWWTMS